MNLTGTRWSSLADGRREKTVSTLEPRTMEITEPEGGREGRYGRGGIEGSTSAGPVEAPHAPRGPASISGPSLRQ